jgi:hypothetical protein
MQYLPHCAVEFSAKTPTIWTWIYDTSTPDDSSPKQLPYSKHWNWSVQRTPATQDATSTKVGKTCLNCGKKVHFALHFPNRHQQQTPTQGTAPRLNSNGNSTTIQAKQNYARGRVNLVAMEEA